VRLNILKPPLREVLKVLVTLFCLQYSRDSWVLSRGLDGVFENC